MGFFSRFLKKKNIKKETQELKEKLPDIPITVPLPKTNDSKKNPDCVTEEKIRVELPIQKNKGISTNVENLKIKNNIIPMFSNVPSCITENFQTQNMDKDTILSHLLKEILVLKQNKLYDNNGYDYTGYDKDGFNKKGFDIEGYNQQGYNKNGFDRSGYNVFQYDGNGKDIQGIDILGYDENGYNQMGFDFEGFNSAGLNIYGHHKYDYDEDGYLLSTGYNDLGYNRYNLDKNGYDPRGYNEFGYDKNGYNELGFDRNGYNYEGYDKDGYDRLGYDKKGFNHSGFNENGFDKDGYDYEGFNLAGYNKDGYDRNGYDIEGFDQYGHNEEYNKFLNIKAEDIANVKVGDILFSPIYGEMEVVFREKNYCGFISSRLKDKPRRTIESIYVYLAQNPPKKVKTSKYGLLSLFRLDNKDFAIGNSFLKEFKRYALNDEVIGKYLYFNMPSEWMCAEENFNLPVFEQETKYLKDTYTYISEVYLSKLKKKLTLQINSAYAKENPMHFSNSSKNHLNEYTIKERYDRLSGEIQRKPYNGSMIINGEKIYIGDHAIEERDVIDWADKRTEYYYQYNLFLSDKSIQIEQVRHYSLMYDRLFMYYDVYDKKNGLQEQDDLLRKVLMAHRKDKQVTNIIESIQSQQFEIIKQDINKNMIVLGCAGSGKTMILFHRLYHVLYNNPDFNIDNVILLSPTDLLVNQTNVLAKQLRLDKVEKYTIPYFMFFIYNQYIKINAGLKDLHLQINVSIENNDQLFNLDYLQEKVALIQDKIQSKKFQNSQYQKINRAYVNVRNILVDKNNDFAESEINEFISTYDASLLLLKKMSINNFVKLEDSIQNKLFLYNDIKQLQNLIQIFNKVNIFDKNDRNEKSLFGRSIKFETKFNKAWEYVEPLRKFVRKFDLQKLIQLNFENAYEFSNYVICNSSRLQKMNVKRILNLMQEMSQLKQSKIDEISLFCLECMDDIKELEEYLELVKFLGKSNYIGFIDYKQNNKIFGSGIDDFKKLKDVYTIFKKSHYFEDSFFQLQIRYGVKDPFELVQLFLHLEELKNRFHLFKMGNIQSWLLDIIYQEIKPDDSIYNLNKCVSYSELFAITFILNQIIGPLTQDRKLIFIDEFQDLSMGEILLLKNAFPQSIFNYYGDVYQCMTQKGINSKKQVKKILDDVDVYELSVNYRNTFEITNFVNEDLDFESKMIATGIQGKVAYIQPTRLDICNNILNTIKSSDRVAFIVKDKSRYKKEFLKGIRTIDIDTNKTNSIPRGRMMLYLVFEAKGLEFETVLVDTSDMNQNEKYVSYTRALNNLFIIKKEEKV